MKKMGIQIILFLFLPPVWTRIQIILQRKKGSKIEKLQNEFLKVTNDIKQELQSAHLEVVDLLKRKLTETTEEKETLHLEYQTA